MPRDISEQREGFGTRAIHAGQQPDPAIRADSSRARLCKPLLAIGGGGRLAEIFAVLMVPEERALVEQWAKDDAILSAKLRYMQELADRYLERAAAAQKHQPTSRPSPAAAGTD